MNRKVKSLMMLKGLRSKDIAKDLGVTETWVSLVLNGRRRSPRVRQAFADALGMNVEELWPNGNNKAA